MRLRDGLAFLQETHELLGADVGDRNLLCPSGSAAFEDVTIYPKQCNCFLVPKIDVLQALLAQIVKRRIPCHGPNPTKSCYCAERDVESAQMPLT
jgi:hypothetical protein